MSVAVSPAGSFLFQRQFFAACQCLHLKYSPEINISHLLAIFSCDLVGTHRFYPLVEGRSIRVRNTRCALRPNEETIPSVCWAATRPQLLMVPPTNLPSILSQHVNLRSVYAASVFLARQRAPGTPGTPAAASRLPLARPPCQTANTALLCVSDSRLMRHKPAANRSREELITVWELKLSFFVVQKKLFFRRWGFDFLLFFVLLKQVWILFFCGSEVASWWCHRTCLGLESVS